jgi:uncharacterized protein (DUF58 family)
MRVTRRFWGVIAVVLAFAILTVLLNEPLYLGASILSSAWLIAAQVAFTADLRETTNSLDVGVTATPERVLEAQDVQLSLTAALETAPRSTCELTLNPPLSMDAEPATVNLDSGATATERISGSFGVTGRFTISRPMLEARGSRGLFMESMPVGDGVTITVEPNVPRDAVVLSDGDRIGVGFGEHGGSQGSSGFASGELRKYVAGDPTNRIDWNATARLGEPYIRETEPETDRETNVFLDHRATLGDGPAGRTQLDYLREAAVWLVEHAASLGDPLGFRSIGAAGTTTSFVTKSGPTHYSRIKTQLYDLTPTERDDVRSEFSVANTPKVSGSSDFERTLRPFFEHRESYVQRVESQPLFEAVRAQLTRRNRSPWVVLLTDDSSRAELVETVKLAYRQNAPVTVFLTPNALFADGGLTDLENAYADYQAFQEFQSVLRDHGATVYEVGSSNRIDAVLATQSAGGRRSSP